MFELKVLFTAPGLEAALNNLASAIAGSTVTTTGYVPALSSIPHAPVDDSDDDLPGALPDMTGQLDKWGLPWDARIHANASEKIAKGTGLWKKRKGVEETFFQRTLTELIKAAVAAGVYTGPADLVPKPEGYMAPVVTADPTGVVVPPPPAATTPPVVTAPPAQVPAPPAATGTVYTHDVLQSAVMKMFSNPSIGANAAEIGPRLMALYDVAAIQNTPAEKLESFVKLVEAIDSSPADCLATLSKAENAKIMGIGF